MLAVLLLVAAAPAPAAEPSSEPQSDVRSEAQAVLDGFLGAIARLDAYTLHMQRQQRIKGQMQPTEEIEVKQQRSPDCRYLKWVGERHQGRELIWCPQRYDGEIQAHEGGLLGVLSLSLKPDGDFYRRTGQLHHIDESGLYALARFAQLDADYLRAHPEEPARLSRRSVAGAASTCIDIEHGPSPFSTYSLGRRSLCIADESHLPTELQAWNTEGLLMEHYVYSGYRLNPPLDDRDFDTRNPDYHF